jgi:2,5-diamino-6-(ribosylamino)-4(3H)-pyrimidinone 5'-phosphate reductase
VIVNFAMSMDGKIALPSRKQTRISDEEDLRRVHRLRAACDAVLVGVGTILADDPKLTVKPEYASGRNPLRVVLDSEGRTPPDAHVLNREAPTLVVTSSECERTFGDAEVVRFGKDSVDLAALLDHLGERGMAQLLVEGGEEVIWSFLHGRLADEVKVFVGSMVIGGRNAPTAAGGAGAQTLEEVVPLKLQAAKPLGEGVLLEYAVVK